MSSYNIFIDIRLIFMLNLFYTTELNNYYRFWFGTFLLGASGCCIIECPNKNIKTRFLNFWQRHKTNFAHFLPPGEWISSILEYIWSKYVVGATYLDIWEIFETPCKCDFCVCRAKNWSKLITFKKGKEGCG